jgi:hypothetical protein
MPINVVARDLIKRFTVTSYVETGLWNGESIRDVAQWFWELDEEFRNLRPAKHKIYGVEILKEKADLVRSMYGPNPNCTIVCGSSDTYMAKLVSNGVLQNESVLAFLDAHKPGPLPLRGELQALMKLRCRSLVVMIDDYYAPGKPWNYDSYASGETIGTKLIADVIRPRVPTVWICNTPTIFRKGWPSQTDTQGEDQVRTVGCLFFDLTDAQVAEKLLGLDFYGDPV